MSFFQTLFAGFRSVCKFLLTSPVTWIAGHFSSFPKQENVNASLSQLYKQIIAGNEKKGKLFEFRPNEHPVIIFSDQHKGARNGSDDFRMAEDNYIKALEFYNDKKYFYLNLGDSEELWENNILSVLNHNTAVFATEKLFVDRKAFYKIYGNHDLFWDNDPFAPLYLKKMYGDKVKINAGVVLRINLPERNIDIFCTHGHQGDAQSDGNAFSKWFVSYIWGPLQSFLEINTNTPSTNNDRKSQHNEFMYEWSARQKNIILITGHTHQPVFKSLTHLERLYLGCEEAEIRGDIAAIEKIEAEIPRRKREYDRLNIQFRNMKPTYFNAGCCCFEDGNITGIEISDGYVRLVKWCKVEGVPTRIVAEEEKLENISAKI
jgi:UDP-2,3-diacylglucosamine pyrophosphatase LpxH